MCLIILENNFFSFFHSHEPCFINANFFIFSCKLEKMDFENYIGQVYTLFNVYYSSKTTILFIINNVVKDIHK